MKRKFLPVGCCTVVALTALSFAPTASAGSFIYVDALTTISSYTLPSGTPVTTISSSAISQDAGLAFNPSNVLFASTASGIYSYSYTGASTLFATVTDAAHIAIDPTGDIYVGALLAGNTQALIEFPAGGGCANATCANVINGSTTVDSLAFDSSGNLYEADASGNIIEYVGGGTSQTPIASKLNTTYGSNPYGLAVDSSGDIFFTYESGLGGGLEEITASDTFQNVATFAGTSSSTDITPLGLVYGAGNLYMSWTDVILGTNGVYAFTPNVSGGFTQSTLTSLSHTAGGIAFITPEPGSLMLLVAGLLSLAFAQWRRGVRQ